MTAATRHALLGVFTGLLTLTGMLRLLAGGFAAGLSAAIVFVTLLVLVPWVVYVGWRAYRGRLTRRSELAVACLDVLGAVLVWLSTFGPVAALALSLTAFAVIWISDWPARRPAEQRRVVTISELSDDGDATHAES